jgi:hypothetical protein
VDDALHATAEEARAQVTSGQLRGARLMERLVSVPFRDRDVWTDRLLGIPDLPDDTAELPRGAVPYVPCSVDDIVAMVREVPVRADDRVVDLGAGLGRVLLVAHLLTGARAHGVEIQESLVRAARACARDLGLTEVTFEHANAAQSVLDGSIFFMHAPFNGPMLDAVISRLHAVAARRAIVVAAVGMEFPGVTWLHPLPTSSVTLALYESRVTGVPHR